LAVTKDWFDEKRGSVKGEREWGGRDTKLAGTGKWQSCCHVQPVSNEYP